MTPRSLSEIFDNVRDLGAATGRAVEADALVNDCTARLAALSERMAKAATRPRVFCMEWLDPVYASGHWVPELVKIAGGIDELGSEGGESVRVSWDDVAAWAPEVLVIMPCGFNLEQTMKQIWSVFASYGSGTGKSHFFNLPAIKNNRVFAVDANAYFARPGPRVVEGAELLARVIHPELVDNTPSDTFQPVDIDLLKGVLREGKDYNLENGAMVFTAGYLQRRGYCCDSGCRNCPY
jgi:iron complex transport system substrate-binding protein